MSIAILFPYFVALAACRFGYLATNAGRRASNAVLDPKERKAATRIYDDNTMFAVALGAIALLYSLGSMILQFVWSLYLRGAAW